MVKATTIKVLKFGGSSLADDAGFQAACEKIKEQMQSAHVLVVVSARGDATNLAQQQCDHYDANAAETAVLLATGEQASTAMFSAYLNQHDVPARSFQGWQLPIMTNDQCIQAVIDSIDTTSLMEVMSCGVVPVVSGFQGVTPAGDVSTLARGGSDTTAVALAAALGASECLVYTDVPGVCTADPRRVSEARVIDQLDYEVMLTMANMGAGVLSPRSVAMAKQYHVPLWVKKTRSDQPGTQVSRLVKSASMVEALAHMSDLKSIKITHSTDFMAEVLPSLRGFHAPMMGYESRAGCYEMSLVMRVDHGLCEAWRIKGYGVTVVDHVAMISLVGAMAQQESVLLQQVIEVLADVPLLKWGLTALKLTLVMPQKHLDQALNQLHIAFDLARSNSCIE